MLISSLDDTPVAKSYLRAVILPLDLLLLALSRLMLGAYPLPLLNPCISWITRHHGISVCVSAPWRCGLR